MHEAARQSGRGSLAQVHTVLLMRDGTLGVIDHDSVGDLSSVRPFVEQTGKA